MSLTLQEAAPPVVAEQEPYCPGVTPRVIAFSLVLAVLFGLLIPVVDYKFSNTFLGAAHLPAAAVAVLLFMLLVVQPIMRALPGRGKLTRNEMLTVYITCLFSALVPGRGGENFFVPNTIASFYFSTQDNKWAELFSRLPSWLTPALNADGSYNKPLVDGWYNGIHNAPIPWGAWMVPLVAWCALILALHAMLGCLGVMLRAQWAEREALAFPLLKLPLEMTENPDGAVIPPFFKNSAMWIGFAIAVWIELFNGLALYYPDFPAVPLSINTGPMLSEVPWNQIGSLEIRVYPAVLGIAFLLTSEVSFSLWFLYLFTKVQMMFGYTIGIPAGVMDAPFWTRNWAKGFIGYEQLGAYFAYVGMLLWLGRAHFGHIARRALGKVAASESEKGEALSYPMAFWGFWGCFAFVVLWTALAGVSPIVALLLWLTYLAVALGLTRMVAEGGLMFVHTGWMTLGPLSHLIGAGKGTLITGATAGPASMISGSLMFEMRGFLLPSYVQSFKLAYDRHIASRKLFWLIAACVVVSFWLSVFTVVSMGYSVGALQMQKWWISATQPAIHAAQMDRGLNTSYSFNWIWTAVGAAMTVGMMVARSHLPWFPLHPIGLLMCVPFAMYTMWVSIMLGWLAKTLILRFGGTDSYRKAIPAFLGLALGDISMAVFWVIVDAMNGRTGHSLLPF